LKENLATGMYIAKQEKISDIIFVVCYIVEQRNQDSLTPQKALLSDGVNQVTSIYRVYYKMMN